MGWYVYLLECRNGHLYCGIAIDVDERIAAHNAGTGAKYTAGRGPIVVVYRRRCMSKSLALRLEYAIKQLTKTEKQELLANPARVTSIVRRLRPARAA